MRPPADSRTWRGVPVGSLTVQIKGPPQASAEEVHAKRTTTKPSRRIGVQRPDISAGKQDNRCKLSGSEAEGNPWRGEQVSRDSRCRGIRKTAPELEPWPCRPQVV